MKIYDTHVFLQILPVLIFLHFIGICNTGKIGVEASHTIYPRYQNLPGVNVGDQVHRTAYHFQPPKHWMNDPNGPMYFNGYYHLFYQYNPKGSVWGHIVWAHSVSKDLVNWIGLEPAIYPSKPFDQFGCWSGSTTILPGNRPVILYTGVIDRNQTQVQNYAIPANISDPYLREWVKPDDNPLIVATEGVNKTAFRDPTTAWIHPDGDYRILIGGRNKETGIAHLYKSKDFKKWTKPDQDLHSADNVGNWECPDFYTVTTNGSGPGSNQSPNPKHVLKISLDETRFDYYTMGTYYPEKDIYVPDNTSADNWKGLRMDYGSFYASKSFFDPVKNRRVIWAWANESDHSEDDKRKGWAGILLIPRTVKLDPNGRQLLQWPIEELNGLRGQPVGLSNRVVKKGERVEVAGITANQADVEVTFSFSGLDSAEPFDPRWRDLDAQAVCSERGSNVEGGLGPFGLLTLATQDLQEYTPVFFRVFKDGQNHKVLLCSDGRRASLNKNVSAPSFGGFVDVDLTVEKKLSLRSLIDHSVVEAFGEGGKVCVSSRVYPTMAVADKAFLYAFNNGTEDVTIESLNAWSIGNATITFIK